MKQLLFMTLLGSILAAQTGTAPGAEPREHVIRIVSDLDTMQMRFAPKHLKISPGDTVTWVNEARIDHNVMTYPDGYPEGAEALMSSYMSEAGERWSYTFRVGGTYEYHCLPHLLMGMHVSIVVGEPSALDEFHTPTKAEIRAYRDRLLEYFDGDDAEFDPRETRAAKTR